MCLVRLGNKDDEYGVFKEYGYGYALPKWCIDRHRQYDLLGIVRAGGKNG